MNVIKTIAASAFSGQFEKTATNKFKVSGTFTTNKEKVLMQLSASVFAPDGRQLCSVTAYRPGGSDSMRYNIHDAGGSEVASVVSSVEEVVTNIETELKE